MSCEVAKYNQGGEKEKKNEGLELDTNWKNGTQKN